MPVMEEYTSCSHAENMKKQKPSNENKRTWMKYINIVIPALFPQTNSARSGPGMEEPQLYLCADVLTTQWSRRLEEPPLKSLYLCYPCKKNLY